MIGWSHVCVNKQLTSAPIKVAGECIISTNWYSNALKENNVLTVRRVQTSSFPLLPIVALIWQQHFERNHLRCQSNLSLLRIEVFLVLLSPTKTCFLKHYLSLLNCYQTLVTCSLGFSSLTFIECSQVYLTDSYIFFTHPQSPPVRLLCPSIPLRPLSPAFRASLSAGSLSMRSIGLQPAQSMTLTVCSYRSN